MFIVLLVLSFSCVLLSDANSSTGSLKHVSTTASYNANGLPSLSDSKVDKSSKDGSSVISKLRDGKFLLKSGRIAKENPITISDGQLLINKHISGDRYHKNAFINKPSFPSADDKKSNGDLVASRQTHNSDNSGKPHSKIDNVEASSMGNRFRRNTPPRNDLLQLNAKGWETLRWLYDCGQNCEARNESPETAESTEEQLNDIPNEGDEQSVRKPPFPSLISKKLKHKQNSAFPGVNIWNSLNLSGQRQIPLYADEPNYVLVRREKAFPPKMKHPEYSDDPFIPPRGRKDSPILRDLFKHYELFVPNRGKKDKVNDIFKYDDLFFPNRGKRQIVSNQEQLKPMIDISASADHPQALSVSDGGMTENIFASVKNINCQDGEHELIYSNDCDQSGHTKTNLKHQRLANEDNLSLRMSGAEGTPRPQRRDPNNQHQEEMYQPQQLDEKRYYHHQRDHRSSWSRQTSQGERQTAAPLSIRHRHQIDSVGEDRVAAIENFD